MYDLYKFMWIYNINIWMFTGIYRYGSIQTGADLYRILQD